MRGQRGPVSGTGPPRVMHVISHLNMGGAEEVAITLAEQLYQDYELSFFAVMGEADNSVGRYFARRLAACGVPVYRGTGLDMKRGGLLEAGWRLRQVIRQLRPQIVHLHTEIPEATYACAALLSGTGGASPPPRLVRTIHNSNLWPAWTRIGAWTERRVRRAEVAAVSSASLEGLWSFQTAQRLPRTPTDRARIIHNGVKLPQGQPALIGRPGRERPVRVLFAGRFEDQKGADLLPQIFEQVARQSVTRAVELHLLGSGTHGPLLERWAQEQLTGWDVTLKPPVADLAAQLGQYDVVVLPSRFEGLALIAIEALVAGVPVVAFRAPGLSEVFPNTYPLLSAPGDVAGLAQLLAQVIDQPEEWQRAMVPHSTYARQHFSLEGMTERYRQLYRGTLVPLARQAAQPRVAQMGEPV